ncbi:solute carrier organic anion transporter family member 2B1 isoform X1 [Pleuronectes platessa]|uniref:solute carrier organic anion transporter family member 2B1 isoform X1 n=2 Tax=Pleuronectes platessa TaxID=8262 RepID=UPI00232A18BA|nr:solute carrier organic anion transporter family member 2B1 isoform X1 [Pleuronectes platessa]XP_053297618.1 solute carrier organic anion transporter family member 2B1 isoform X1 [Pleuronectes platessa]XP_053297619.1 solute carrier organic anion transporter family member 2B1 isoform X1 [Pleuronectes platessa]XP_053297620.1 solute carrier organic anion transporter family member 2B1 isoform X1 [Pleuronectes platessa]XP_053297621.1 solute carrier organic anion transporter family member 2B1 isofo
MGVDEVRVTSDPSGSRPRARPQGVFHSIKFFVLCHSLLQLAQLLVSGYMKSSISTIERRYGLSSQKSGLLAAFNEVGNTMLIVFVSFLGSRVHRPRFIGGGALLAGLASLMMALPHFLSGPYDYSSSTSSASSLNSSLCQSTNVFSTSSSNQSCSRQQSPTQERVYPLLLLAQLLLGVASVPIQPFGISYIDDYASKRNAPLYLGILLAVTSIGPALGFITSSQMLRLYVDFDKLSTDQIRLESKDLRWVGAWWLGFLVASGLLVLVALPYLFFPRVMPREGGVDDAESRPDDQLQHLPVLQFLKSFPRIALRTLQSPVFLLVVLAQVNLAALLAGLATFMAKFIERQFSQTVSFSTLMIGGVGIPMAVLGTVLGGVLMRRLNLSVSGASKLCTIAILLCIMSSVPLLLIGCSTQRVAGVFPPDPDALSCSSSCGCPQDVFNPVCGSDGVEFRSPCHAGCEGMEIKHKVTNYTECRCVTGLKHAAPGTCGSGCAHLLRPFMALLGITSFIAAFSQTPSYMMILRTVSTEDKSFAVGVQYMLFRMLAFMPSPVLYGSVIDTTCILWGRKCDKQTSCLYYNLDRFRQRFLGLQVVFVCGGMLCFLLTIVVLRRSTRRQEPEEDGKGYELVTEQKTPEDASSRGKEEKGVKT